VRELAAAAPGGAPITFREFTEVKHGFAVRGPKKDPLVAAAREEALALAGEHFRAAL